MACHRAGRAPRSDRSTAQHLVLLCGFCRVAAGPDGNGDSIAPEILGTQSRVWCCTTFLDDGAVLDGEASRSRRDRRVLPSAVSGLQYDYIRAAMVVAFRLFDLPRPNPSAFRENSHSRCGELRG